LPEPSSPVTVTSRITDDGWVEVEVADEGVGISPENLQRLCDPFFTTKFDSGGTGLGLSVTHSLVKAHGGRLSFTSEVNRGTRATVAFPPIVAEDPT
jgi:signal transduction histidine kinase